MKIAVVLFAIVTLCVGTPTVPRDNSHYVAGESRYIWIPDVEGKLYLVDLQAPADEEFLDTMNGAGNEYWLFTRENPQNHQLLVNGDANSILNSNYKENRPTKVIVHGWTNSGSSPINQLIAPAFLAAGDFNVIVLDWSWASGRPYVSAINAVSDVGRQLANFLTFLFQTAGGDWNKLHLVGHSLGAHVVGNAGRATPQLPDRVTGLDPAGPLWHRNANALSASSAVFVESIHTDGGVFGIMNPISHVDFYPNGGRNPQPGCSTSDCSHGRAFELFAASVRKNHLVGRLCSDLQQARNVQCNGDALEMGNTQLGKRGSGLYGLRTQDSWPF